MVSGESRAPHGPAGPADRPAPGQPSGTGRFWAAIPRPPSWAKRRKQPARGSSCRAPGVGVGDAGVSASLRLRVGRGGQHQGAARPRRGPAHARAPTSASRAPRLWLRPQDGPPEPPSAQPRPAGPGAAEPAGPCVCVRGAPSQPREDGGGGGGD